MVLSTEPAPAASVRQDYGQLHKHFTDKDGQLFTDEAKVLLAAATAWARMCVCVEKVWVCEKVRERERERRRVVGRERMTKRALNVRPLLVWTPTGLSAGTHLSNALNAAPTLDCTISLSATKYRARGIRRSLSAVSNPSCAPPTVRLRHSSPSFICSSPHVVATWIRLAESRWPLCFQKSSV